MKKNLIQYLKIEKTCINKNMTTKNLFKLLTISMTVSSTWNAGYRPNFIDCAEQHRIGVCDS